MKHIKLFYTLLFVLFALPMFAQKSELGFGIGGTNYKGDLNPTPHYKNTTKAQEIFFRYNPVSFIGLRIGYLWGGVRGADELNSDPFLKARNFHFNGKIKEFSFRTEYNFFNFRAKKKSEKWCPFLFIGAAALNFKVKNNYVEGELKSTQFVIPFGVGLKHKLTPLWNLNFEIGARKMFSDNLDGIVQDENVLRLQRINPDNRDLLIYTGISISYVFGGIKCPVY